MESTRPCTRLKSQPTSASPGKANFLNRCCSYRRCPAIPCNWPCAVPTLEALIGAGHTVPLVVTQPDRPAGRSRAPRPSAVKAAAERLDLQLVQPAKIRTATFLESLRAAEPDVLVVVAKQRRRDAVERHRDPAEGERQRNLLGLEMLPVSKVGPKDRHDRPHRGRVPGLTKGSQPGGIDCRILSQRRTWR